MSNASHENRAGRYVHQTGGYRAFIPAPLPPEPPVIISENMQELLSRADRALGRLDGSIQTLPHPDLFVAMYVRKEAVLSSQIEGTQSSLQDVLAAEAQMLSPDSPKDVDEVFNYISAMNHGLQRLGELPLSIRLIREIHSKLVSGVRGQHLTPGELRRTQNWIGPAGCTLNEASYVPPPPDRVAEFLGQLERFIHQSTQLPLLVKIGLVHAQFETIHPFLDGNGRIGRLLISFLLCERDVLIKPVLYLSHYLKRHRLEYYDRLQRIRDAGDWEGWMEFFLEGVLQVSKEATSTARGILHLRERHRNQITEELGRSTGIGFQLLEQLYRSPMVSVKKAQDVVKTTYSTANNLVSKFEEMGILKEMTGQKRNRQYIYEDYIALFRDDTAPPPGQDQVTHP